MSDVHEHYAAINGDIMPDGTPAPPTPAQNDGPVRVSAPYAPADPFFAFADDDAGDDLAPDRPSFFTRRKLIIGGAIVVVLAIVGGLIAHAAQPAKVPLRYTFATAARSNLTVTTATTGQISSGVYNLNFFTSGKVAEIDVAPGQNVQAGQVLAKLDTTSLQDSLNSAQTGFNSAQVNLNNAYTNQTYSDRIAYDTYEQNIQRDQGNAEKLQEDQDQYNQALTQAQSQVNSARAQYANAQAQLTAAQHNLANATLTAPVSGQIAAVNGQVGVASSSGSNAFIVLVNLNNLTIAAQVNEADIGNIQAGQPVSFTVQAFAQDTFYGTVAAISPIGTTTQNVVTYPVTVNIDPASAKQARLFPGMTASLTITTKQIIDALLVPSAALTYARTAVRSGRVTTAQAQQAIAQAQQLIANATDDATKQGTASYVLEQQNGQIVAVPVVTGFTNGTDTVILAGLSENDTIIAGDNQAASATTNQNTGTQRLRGGAGGSLFGGGR